MEHKAALEPLNFLASCHACPCCSHSLGMGKVVNNGVAVFDGGDESEKLTLAIETFTSMLSQTRLLPLQRYPTY